MYEEHLLINLKVVIRGHGNEPNQGEVKVMARVY